MPGFLIYIFRRGEPASEDDAVAGQLAVDGTGMLQQIIVVHHDAAFLLSREDKESCETPL